MLNNNLTINPIIVAIKDEVIIARNLGCFFKKFIMKLTR